MNKRGFTLIELLVVVLIMGILASVAMPQYFKSVEKSRASEAINILSTLADAQERHYMQTGSYFCNDNISETNSDLDINVTNLTYFRAHATGDSGGYGCRHLYADRIDNAGGGLGYYVIELYLPVPPGSGKRTWGCYPKSKGCTSFLPVAASETSGS